MNKISRVLVLILSIALILAYFVPIWKIDLQAPQYPEGLGMKIWINKLAGDISTINGLNHYIGMQKIDETSIPELRYMPYLLGIIIGMGILVSLAGKKWFLYTWVFLFAALGIAGGIDFYLWEYDYGHNLDPRAAIKIPGMTYQPPLFGSKELLNFIAHSYPDIGGWTIILAGLFAIGITVYNQIIEKENKPKSMKNTFNTTSKLLTIIPIFICSIVLFSCKTGPEPINYGKDMCDHCKMKIMDERFGAEITTKQGKVFKFDAIECMVNYYNELDNSRKEKINLKLVTNAAKKGELIPADKAIYLLSENFPSPMGSNISAYLLQNEIEVFKMEFSGEIISWQDAQNKILK